MTSTWQTEFCAWAARPRPGWESFEAGHWGPPGSRSFSDPFAGDDGPVSYETATWTSPWHRLPVPAQEVIVSFNAMTPGRSWIEVEIQVSGAAAIPAGSADRDLLSRWFTMARWCQDLPDPHRPGSGGAIHRATVDGQSDPCARVDTDTLIAEEGRAVTRYRLRATLLHPTGAPERPGVTLLGAAASSPTSPSGTRVSPSGSGAGRELAVRPLSQMVHAGRHPQWGGGGESWCSPASVAMAMGFHGVAEPVDALVPRTVRGTWDHQYAGAGNWAFSAAHAATHGLDAFVTRLPDLRALEEYIITGLPVVVSASFRAAELDGAGYSTAGHLMLVTGFTADGDVIVNDPASHEEACDSRVRTIYRRDQFERVWQKGSGGAVYVIAPPGTPLPTTR